MRSVDLFAGINDGDKVRVEFKDGAIEGLLCIRKDGGQCVRIIGYDEAFVGNVVPSITRVTVLERALPPEPPKGAIVVDRDGDAWQRSFYHPDGSGLWLPAQGGRYVDWLELCTMGPRILWTPDGAK